MVTKVIAEMVEVTPELTLAQLVDLQVTLAEMYGVTSTGDSVTNTTHLNEAIVAASTGLVLLPVDAAFEETSVVFASDVVVLCPKSNGSLEFFVSDFGSTPTAEGGITLRSQGHTPVLLRAIDYGVASEPLLQTVNKLTGNLSALQTKFIELQEITSATAPGANKARLYIKDDGVGNTVLGVQFATGTFQQLATTSPAVTEYNASLVYNPANILHTRSETTTVAVAGAVLGDFVLVSFSLDLQGLSLTGYVSAADTVTVVFNNLTAAAVDLAEGTLYVRVIRR